MSQEKVDKYKQEKYNRKHAKKKANIKKIAAYVIATIIALAFVFWVGRSILIEMGVVETTQEATYRELSEEEIESIRQQKIENGDITTEAAENAETEAETAEVETAEAETTAE